jgi:AraC-like DNA-binding protein
VTSATLRQSMQRTAKYYRAATQRVELTLVEQDDVGALVYTRLPGVQQHRIWMEFSLAILVQRVRACLGAPFRPLSVAFAHPLVGAERPYVDYFQAPVRFDAPYDTVRLPRAILDLPLRTAQAQLAEVLEAQLGSLVGPSTDPFVEQVRRQIIKGLERQDVSLESVVDALGLPRRTVQRALQQQRTSHQRLLDEVRAQRAVALLEKGDKTIDDIAQELAFSETTAFFRAVRRWTGRTPSDIKRAGNPAPKLEV